MSFITLPSEILHSILSFLDLKSIFDLSLTNHTNNAKIYTHRIYHLLTTNPTTIQTLKILSQTTLLQTHTLSTLTKSLITTTTTTITTTNTIVPTCPCCHRQPAPYLHLPTATRVCFSCLHHCPLYQLIPLRLASETFDLPTRTLQAITLLTIPGLYETDIGTLAHNVATPLVNAAQARDLAVRTLGSNTALDTHMAKRNVDVAQYLMPLVSFGYFVTPYTSMRLDVCEVRLKGGSLLDAAVPVPVPRRYEVEKWKGVVGMGCEPWPYLNRETGSLELVEGEVVRYRVANHYGRVWRCE